RPIDDSARAAISGVAGAFHQSGDVAARDRIAVEIDAQFERELAAIIIRTIEADLAAGAGAERLVEGTAEGGAGDALARIAGEEIADGGIVDGFHKGDGGGVIALGGSA